MNILVTDLSTGQIIHSGYYAELAHVWAPTSEVVAAWFGVSEEDVHCGESDEGDTIEINGKPVATIEHTYRRAELRRPMLVAAE